MPKYKFVLPDLDTRSVLNVVEGNFQHFELKTYAIRMIYTGEFAIDSVEMIEHFTKSVNDVNAYYCDIHLTGLLLCYESYFVHVIEGSEDTLFRHLRFLFDAEKKYIDKMTKLDEEEAAALLALETESFRSAKSKKSKADRDDDTTDQEDHEPEKPDRRIFRRLKLMMIYHSIKAAKFTNWRCLTARPPTLVSKLDVYAPLPYHAEQLKVLMNKIDLLVRYAKRDQQLSFVGLTAADAIMNSLPEVALLDFVLQSQYFLDVRRCFYLFRRVDDHVFYHEIVWPVPTHYTPRFLYKLKIDDTFVEPLPVMPWEKKEEDEEDPEEKEDRQSDSDDSN